MIERSHFKTIESRINEARSFIQVIMGPRQVGKTTLVNQLLRKTKIPHLFVSADAVAATDLGWLKQQWDTARAQMQSANATEFLLVVDEIQKIDNWSEMVKLSWDLDTRENRNLKVTLLGSSRLLLQQGLTESLTGRFETTYMGHWSFSEMQQAFDWSVDEFVWFGGYPGAAILKDNEERWKRYILDSIIETSISKDILMLTRIDKPALMKRLFEFGCMYSGQILAYNKMLGQLVDAGNTTTLSHYLKLLDTAGLLAGLEKFDRKITRKRASSPKFQAHNTALVSAQQAASFAEVRKQPDAWGRMVESAVGAHLINAAYSEGYGLHYWREGNHEVDFVIEWKGKVLGLEVKSGRTQTAGGMSAFHKQLQPDRLVLLGDGGVPWQDFLRMNPLELF